MASVKAFNTLMQQFLDELSNVFPKEATLKMFTTQFPNLVSVNPRKPMELFTALYAPYAAKIQSRDETVFDDVPTLFGEIDVRGLWSKCDAGTKEAIWKYIQHLTFVSTTVSLIPPEMLSMIETVAQDCAGKFERGEIDPTQIMNMLPQMLQGMQSLPSK